MITDSIFTEVETLPLSEVNRLVLSKLTAILSLASRGSTFYRERIPFQVIHDFKDLESIPILTKEDLASNMPPVSDSMLTDKLYNASIYRSGGTTGKPKFTLYSNDEFEEFSNIFVRTYYSAGLRKDDKVANLFFCGDLYPSFIFVHKLIQKLGCINFPVAGSTPPRQVIEYIRMFGINAVLGPTSYIVNLVKMLAAGNLQNDGLNKVLYAGEPLYETDREFLLQVLGQDANIRSAGYGCADLGLIGYQCLAQTGPVHHILFDHVYVEIVDPETNKVVEDGEQGDIIVTSLDKRLVPFIRFKIGDRGRKLKEKCSCGRSGQLLELLGRDDDTVRIGYTNVSYKDILEALGARRPFTTNMQLIKEQGKGRTRLVLRIETDQNHYDTEAQELQDTVYREIFNLYPNLEAEEKRGIVDISVQILAFGQIERMRTTGKIKRIVQKYT
ncbi:MAG: AMP-binding protein [Bacillota bacterium]|nr:AMP-binding protein [Bacillota bacterium]